MADIPVKEAVAPDHVGEPNFFRDTLPAALETESMFGGLYNQALVNGLIDPDSDIFPNPRNIRPQFGSASPGRALDFNVFDMPEVQQNPAILKWVWDVEGEQDFRERLELHRAAEEARAEVARDQNSIYAVLGASLANPDVIIGGGIAGGAGRIGGALRTAGALGAITATQEGILNSADPGRDPAAGAAAVLTAGVVGFGLGLAGPMSKSARRNDIPIAEATAQANRPPGPTTADFLRDESGTLNINPNRKDKRANESVSEKHERKLKQERDLNQEGPVPTGTRIEELPLNPVLRSLQRSAVSARRTVEELVDMGGIIKKKNRAGVATERSVETNYRTNHLNSLFEAIDAQNQAFLAYRGKRDPGTAGRRILHSQGTRLRDAMRGRNSDNTQFTYREFREEVGMAMKNGGQHATPEVAQAAVKYRKILDDMGKEANEVGLFERALRRDLNNLERELSSAARKGEDPAALQRRKVRLQQKLDNLKAHGPDAGPNKSFFPRVYRTDKILDNQQRFIDRVTDGLRDANPGMTRQAARTAAKDVLRNITGIKPHLGHVPDELRKGAGDASSARARMLDIDDQFLQEFVENDVEVVLRSYHKSIGTDIELTKKFGDHSMAERILEVAAEYDQLIKETKDAAEAGRLQVEKAEAIADIENMRDIVRGTFGASNDPFSATTKFAKGMKAANVVLMLGGAAVSSFADVGRFAMTEGIAKGYGPILKSFTTENGKLLRQMSKKELNLAGEALDMVLGIRALQMADIGQSFGNLSRAERFMQEGANLFFMVNGLNWWNNTMKEWAGLVVGSRILEDVAKKGPNEKLARAGIDPAMASRINDQFVRFGDEIDGVKVANTADWADAEAVAAYRGALSQDVNRTIVTPGAGDKAIWTSTEYGSVVAQFKSFAQATTNRVLVSGMQEADHNMAVGAAILLSMGAVVDATKNILAGRDQPDTAGEIIEGAIDRSGLFGVFQEFNKILEVMSNGQLGIRPMLTDDKAPTTGTDVIGTIGGPTGSTLSRGAQVIGDVVTGNADANTAKTAAKLVPGNNLPFVQPLM